MHYETLSNVTDYGYNKNKNVSECLNEFLKNAQKDIIRWCREQL